MHPLLQRQLKRLGIDPTHLPTDPTAWQAMLERVSQSYAESDQGRLLLERSLDVTSREMQGLYEDLRRSGESDLAKERNKLEAVLHSLGDGLCVVDAQWRIVLMNPQAEHLFQQPIEALRGTPIYHLLSPGPEEFSHECLVTDAALPPLEQGVPYRTDDGILLQGDGQMLPVSLVVTPVSSEGVVSGAVLVFRDVTAEKRAEEQRTESAALLRRVQAGLLELATNTGLYRGDRAQAFRVITEVAANTLRVARASIWFFNDTRTAIRCADLYEQTDDRHSCGIELPATGFPRYFAELATEDIIVANDAQTDPKTAEFATSYLIPFGITSMLDVPVRAEGRMVGVICHEHIGPARTWSAEELQFATSVAGTISLVLETADRLRAEAETQRAKQFLDSVVENLPIMVFVKDAMNLRFVRWNKAAEDITGHHRSDMLGKCDYDFFTKEQADFFTAKDREVIAERQLLTVPNEPIQTKHRGTRTLRTKKVPVLNESGQPEFLLGIAEDITEQQERDLALRENEEKYRCLFESSQDAIMLLFPPEWKFTACNPATVALFGARDVAHFTSLGPWNVSPDLQPDGEPSASKAPKMILRAMEEGSHFFEWTHKKINGPEFAATVLLTRITFKGQTGLQATVRDISEQKRAEEALRKSEARTRMIIDSALDAVITIDASGRIIDWNPRAESIFGWTAAEITGLYLADTIIPPAHRAAHLNGLRAFLETQSGVILNRRIEITALRRDGSEFPIELAVTPLRTGEQVTFTGFVSDISARKQAEARLLDLSTFQKAMLDNAGHAIISTTPDGIIRVFNPAAESLLGYTAEEMIGKHTPAVFHDGDEVATRARLFSAELGTTITPGFDVFVEKSRRGLPNEHEWTYIRKDGFRLTVLLNITALRNSEGEVAAFLGIASDITPLKAVERELIAAKDAAESASVAKSQFLANMSHEIRTPMNGVLGLATLLMQTPLTPKQKRLADTILRSGKSLLDIINDILDFSKIEAGKLELEQTDFHLRMLIDDVLELFAAPAHQKHLELIADVAETVPTFVKGDPARLRQILINLTGNAIKFTPQGEVIVRAVSIAEGEDHSVLCFSVKDSGIGIRPDVLRTIFDPFSQADGSTTRKFGGTGLGLAITKQLVSFMGGEVWAESQPGAGATFFFTVRLAHSHLGGAGTLFSKPALPNHRILVADDSPTLRMALDRQLRSWGLSPTVAESGREAIESVKKAREDGLPFDIVLLDLHMPDLPGLETARILVHGEESAPARVILMTPVEQTDTTEGVDTAAMETLTKPIRTSELYRVLSGTSTSTAAARQAHPAGPHVNTPLRQRRGVILLAEDNAVNQEVTLGMLDILGCSAVAVENGALAVTRSAQEPFNLILMDCQMPEMDGFTATRQIRDREQTQGSRTPIIALTANALQGDRETCLAAGMDDYLSKPFTLEQLRSLLDRWLPANTPTSAGQPNVPPPPSSEPTDTSPVKVQAWESIASLQRPGQPDLLAKIIGLYLKDSDQVVDKIMAAVEAKDYTALREAAHSLKSRSATLGAWRVAELCKQLETGAREQNLTGAADLAGTLQREFAVTCEILQTELNRRAA